MACVIAVAVNNGDSINTINISQAVKRKAAMLSSEIIFPPMAAKDVPPTADNTAAKSILDLWCPDCNVILLSVDSLRADHVGAYGYARDTTPYFDELAKKGVLFENYFSSSFLTPVSEMSVHTGMYPSAHNITNFNTVLPENITTAAQHFAQKGYFTSALLSSPEFWGNPAMRKSLSRGFDRYEPLAVQRAFPTKEYMTGELDVFSDKKFFWWVAIGGVHWPYGAQGENVFADPAYRGIFYNKLLDWGVFRDIYGGMQYPDQQRISGTDIQYVVDQYDNGVRAFDKFLKQFIGELDRNHLLDRTIIVIQSEHGEGLHEHDYFAHYDILDTQTHVPLLILSPRLTRERRVSSFTSSVDVLPTIVEFLGHAPLGQFQGKSLAPIISGGEKDGARKEVFLERNPLWEDVKTFSNRGSEANDPRHKDIGIRTSQWKYILRISKDEMKKISLWQELTGRKMDFPEAELYDLVNDPGETKNVIDRYPNEAAVLREKLTNWFEKISSSSQEVDIEPVIQPYF